MKTFVVLAGLMLVVPHADPKTGEWKSLTVLVLDTTHAGHQLGVKVQKHETTVANFGGNAAVPLNGNWTVKSAASGPIQVEGKDRLLFLGDLHCDGPSPCPGRLPLPRKGCLGAGFETDPGCRIGKRPLVRARLTFTGGWNLRPIEISHDREPRADVVDDSKWGFVNVPEKERPTVTKHQTSHQRSLAGGLVLEAADGAAVTFDPPFESLETLGEQQCARHAGSAGPCAIVRFLNTVKQQKTGSDMPPDIDFHHNLLYDLFEPAPASRFLVFLRENGDPRVLEKLFPKEALKSGDGTRPCIPPALADAIPE